MKSGHAGTRVYTLRRRLLDAANAFSEGGREEIADACMTAADGLMEALRESISNEEFARHIEMYPCDAYD